ncbi:alpha/beta hydrolase domain-containing protein 17B-like [Carya illinoinensis]|uniref:alpha/beta hydrolase domain-containing protein 17B-like n=1 Tax=Carya illinoinensis TaxID=32201 RepID=UPI001C72218E|nr:alpha/beta hydrolase domain-containing protein 17B-like [Carya illinoinensis]
MSILDTGKSSGKPSKQTTYLDIEAAYKCLEESYGTKQEDIILYGQFVVNGPTLDLAARLPQLRAVVLHSPMLSGSRVMYPVKRSYWFDIHKNIDKIPPVNCLVLIIHVFMREMILGMIEMNGLNDLREWYCRDGSRVSSVILAYGAHGRDGNRVRFVISAYSARGRDAEFGANEDPEPEDVALLEE